MPDFRSRHSRNVFGRVFFGGAGIAFLVGFALLISYIGYTMFRIEVATGEMAILIRKTGIDLANAQEVAPTEEHKGVQRQVLTEGRHFRNPFTYDWEVIKQTVIPQGKLGVLISRTGADLGYGQFLAQRDENGEIISKGIVPEVLRPGRYPINPYLFAIEANHEPRVIDAGFKGVVTNLAGAMPANPNELLVQPEERGVQRGTLDPGTYYINPYVTRIDMVDCRSQRFNLSQSGDMGFPSKDGFWVSLDGIIEFHVDPERAAEVYVTYNDSENGEAIDEEIIHKVIMPNARSFCRLQGSNELGRDFIQGVTRTQFQEDFQEAMRNACEPLGIEIVQALITSIRPPEQIAKPVRDREIAKQQELQYKQQILQQQSEQKLAVERATVTQKQALVQAAQEVVTVTTQAEREQEVAVTKANEQLAVAQLVLDATKDKAAAVLARGQAEASVIELQNAAEAAGWKKAVDAFQGNGKAYAQFIMYQKLASAYQQMMVNTADSPIMKVFDAFAGELPETAPRDRPPDVASSNDDADAAAETAAADPAASN